ncbi:hypothetical protein AAHA92_14186 [Salvia divinorum]|uniref:Uncharacterized protein n=1 Tax=Salvia divinorum TaxID=28513 RepID=A0ABD1HAS1_SALDI
MNATVFRMLIFIHYLPAVISELIHHTTVRNLDEVAAQMPLIQILVPRIMNLKPQLRDPSKVSVKVEYLQDYADLSREDQKDF